MSKKVCVECGSEDLQIQVFINLNNGKLIDGLPFHQLNTNDAWCENCQEQTDIIDKEEYEVVSTKREIHEIED